MDRYYKWNNKKSNQVQFKDTFIIDSYADEDH